MPTSAFSVRADTHHNVGDGYTIYADTVARRLGIRTDEPQEVLHVAQGNAYIEGRLKAKSIEVGPVTGWSAMHQGISKSNGGTLGLYTADSKGTLWPRFKVTSLEDIAVATFAHLKRMDFAAAGSSEARFRRSVSVR